MRVSIVTLCVVLCALILIVPVSAITASTIVNRGATIFTGEKDLNITNALNVSNMQRTCIGFWESGASLSRLPSYQNCDVAGHKNFQVLPSMQKGS